MSNNAIPEWKLERYLLGELPPAQMKKMEKLISADGGLKARLRELEASNRAILERYPADDMARYIRTRAVYAGVRTAEGTGKTPGRFSGRLYRILYPASVFATAAVVIFLAKPLVMDRDSMMSKTPVPDTERFKGLAAGLHVYRTADGGVTRLKEGDTVRPGDLLQLAYVAPAEPYGMILSIDGRGAVTLHFPESGKEGEKLIRGRRVLLGRAYRLDDAPGFERFFLVTSRRPIDTKAVMRAAENLAARPRAALKEPLPVSAAYGMRQYSVLLKKEDKP